MSDWTAAPNASEDSDEEGNNDKEEDMSDNSKDTP
jgi:hypothetical protein